MKNKDGFTLIELIAVLVILSLVLIMAVPSVNRLLYKNKVKSYNTKLNVILKQAKQYARDDESFIYGSTSMYDRYVCNTITVGELRQAGYLEELAEDGEKTTIKDPRTNKSMEDKVIMVYLKSSTTGTNMDIYNGNFVSTDKNVSRCNTSTAAFKYTGREETYKIPQTGKYKLEVWGAEGGSANNTYIGGYGAYAYGEINLTKNDILYINVGGEGIHTKDDRQTVKGGYNGGGNATSIDCSEGAGSGGGATSIATKSGVLSTLSSDIDKILIVAAGGGGAVYCESANCGIGGSGGGIKGVDATSEGYSQHSLFGLGASQTAAGCRKNGTYCSKFGVANTYGYSAPSTGGGGGLYAGAGGEKSGAGGGSSYIGNSSLTNKGMYCYNCQESTDASTKTTSTTCNYKNPEVNCSKKGAGYAKITLID